MPAMMIRQRLSTLARLLLLALPLLQAGCGGHAQQTGPMTYAGKRYIVCRVDPTKQQVELFWKDDRGRPFRTFSTLNQWLSGRGKRLIFAMNAGMFQPDFSPVGLYVEHGKQLRPLNLASGGHSNFTLKPNGVFALVRASVPSQALSATKGYAQVIESSRYPTIRPRTLYATQSGPMLVIDGKLHPAFSPTSTSRLIRNGVGVVSGQQVVFAIAEEPVNFHEFATFFRDGLHCNNALYFDGNVSSIYAPTLKRNDAHADLGPMVGVVR